MRSIIIYDYQIQYLSEHKRKSMQALFDCKEDKSNFAKIIFIESCEIDTLEDEHIKSILKTQSMRKLNKKYGTLSSNPKQDIAYYMNWDWFEQEDPSSYQFVN
jgi:hypothetical protein